MEIYSRKIKPQLIRLRVSFVIIMAGCIFAFLNKYLNLGYFLAVVLISMSIIVVKNIRLFSDRFFIVKYFCFGLIKVKWQFEKTDILRLRTFGSEIGAEAEYTDHDPTGTGLGCLFGIFSIFMNNEVVRKEIIIEKLSIIEKVVSKVYIKVEKMESTLLQEFVDEPQPLNRENPW